MKKYTNEDNKNDKNRFRMLLEYDFYIGEEEEVEPEGGLMTEEPPEGEAPDEEMGGEEMGDEEMGDEEMGDEEGFDVPEEEMMGGEPEGFDEPLPEPEPMEDEVELDVTELVQGTEAAKQSSDRANQQIDVLMNKFDNLNASLEKMAAINTKIDDLEHEIEKRNPTPQEQLEMRSLDSYPYSLKLTDYWSEKEGNYDAMGGDKAKDQEYVLTQDEVDRDYNAIEVKDSFIHDPKEDDDDFKTF